MKKENVCIDLYKCTTKQQRHIISLLPTPLYRCQYRVDEFCGLLLFNLSDNMWWVLSCKPPSIIEVGYLEFVRLFEVEETEPTEEIEPTFSMEEKLQADKEELLEALEKANNAVKECDWSENEGFPKLADIYIEIESLIQKHKK